MSVPDFINVQESLAEVIRATGLFSNVYVEASEEEIGNLGNMPLANIRLTEENSTLMRIPHGYDATLTLMVDIITFDFTSYITAARLRGALLASVKTALLANPHFDTNILTSQLTGSTVFGAYGVEGNRGNVAMATLTVNCELEYEA